jgi:hypothetical protein
MIVFMYKWLKNAVFRRERRPGEPPNLTPQPFVIEHNYFVSNYGSGYGVDNDDGSAYLLR